MDVGALIMIRALGQWHLGNDIEATILGHWLCGNGIGVMALRQ